MSKLITSVELDRRTLRMVKQEAKRQHRSVSGQIDLWLAEWVQNHRAAELNRDALARQSGDDQRAC
jgi:hypothetical protein